VWGAPRKRERERECVRERDRDDGVSAMTLLLLLFFRGAFANECDLDLSSWFIILRCLRSCCCSLFSFRAPVVVVAVALCALVCAFVLFVVVGFVLAPLGHYWCFCCCWPLCGFLLFRLNSFDRSTRLLLQCIGHNFASNMHFQILNFIFINNLLPIY